MASWYHLQSGAITALSQAPGTLPDQGFYWFDCTLDEDLGWVPSVEAVSGLNIDELHLEDLANVQHPSHFDVGPGYTLLIIRSLSTKPLFDDNNRLSIKTRPAFFILSDRLLVTYRSQDSKTFEALHHFIESGTIQTAKGVRFAVSDQFLKFKRQPKNAEEMLIQTVSGLIDRYLDIRAEISEKLDRWQRDLLNTRRRFEDWEALLFARNELIRLETVAEDQTDALSDWLDYHCKKSKSDSTIVLKAKDSLEHLERVSGLARRLGESTEAAVQLHFSATAHKTNEIVTVLTLLSAVFMPLTLFTGLFGMNFDDMPLLKSPHGFWIAGSMMVASSLGLVIMIWRIRNKGTRK